MTFSTGSKLTADILEELVNGLISTGSWHNVDTTWNNITRTGNSARRVLAYGNIGTVASTTISSNIVAGISTLPVASSTNFAANMKIIIGSGSDCETRIVVSTIAGSITVDAAINSDHASGTRVMNIDIETYMSIEIINQSSGVQFYYGNQGWWYYGKGLRMAFSKTWNATTHTFPITNPGIDHQSTFIPFEAHNAGVPSELSTLLVSYFMWYETKGFVLMGKGEPSSANTQQSFIVAVERVPTKEYVDTYTNFYCFTTGNVWPYNAMYDGNWVATEWRYRGLLRPFAYQYPYQTGASGSWGNWAINGNGISFSPLPSYYAYKSTGNGKVYYIKPIINNEASQLNPIFQGDLFFLWSEGLGLIDGDVIAVQGQPIKYLCKALDSADSANRLTFAIKYFG